MNKSIRILELPMNIIKKLENNNIFMIYDINIQNLNSIGIGDGDQKIVEDVLLDYKLQGLITEIEVSTPEDKYQFLDLKYNLSDLDLALRTYNALAHSNITKVSEVINLIEKIEIHTIDSMGSKSVINLMSALDKIIEEEALDELIPIFSKNHPNDDLLISRIGLSEGTVANIEAMNIRTLGELRECYLKGNVVDLFSQKTTKLVIEEFKKYYSELVNKNYEFFKRLLIDDYLGKISINNLLSLIETLKDKYYDFNFDLERLLSLLKKNGGIIYEDNLIRLPTLREKLKKVKIKAESEKILLERFKGETLQSVANKFNKTRERIRQIVRDRMSSINLFYEEAFVGEYNKYVWHPQVFKKVFELDDFSFNVVKYLGNKFSFEEDYVFPEEYVLKLRDSSSVAYFDLEEFKTSLPDIFLPRILIYGKTLEKMSKRVYLEYVIENFVPDKGMHKSKIASLANKISDENKLDYYFDKYIDIVTNTVQGLQNVRYYDYNKLSESDIDDLKKIVYEVDSVYSCTYFYIKHNDLMNRLDIRDGYELHFILRRFFSNSDEFLGKVDFNRQPMIAIHGRTFADVVIENWEKLDKEIELEVFVNNLIENYGFHSGTLINIINLTLGDYISLKVLHKKKPVVSSKHLTMIKDVMKDTFYELGELALILKDLGIEESDYQYFSNFWLSDLGYKTHDVNYIIKQEYTSLKEVFYEVVLREDIYQITDKDRKMRETTLILFIESLREEFLAFLVDKDKLVTMKYLETKGIKEKDFRNYVNALNEYVKKNVFFTYESLKKERFYKEDKRFKIVEDFKLDNDLMIDLIRNIKGIKKTTKGDLFRISKDQTTLGDFLDSLTKSHKFRDFEELKDFVLNNYGFVIKKYEM